MSLSDYLRRELGIIADRLTPGEIRERLAAAETVQLRERPSAAVQGGTRFAVIVVDASVLLEVLLQTQAGRAATTRLE